MSDLALPFVLLLEDDVMAFWCFVRFMGKVRANFLPRSDGVFERLATLGSLLAALDPQLGAHLAALHADHCHFAHRMVAAQMRRELSAELAVRLWEQLWADDLLEALMQQRLVRCNPTDQTRVAEPGAGGLSESGSCTSKVWRIGVTSFRQALCLEGLGKREEGNAEVGDLDLAVPRLEGAGSRVFERGSCTAVESDDVADFARDVSGGPFGSGGVAAASAALQGSSESLDGLEPGVMTAAAPAGEFDVLASPAEDACASAGMPWTTVDPNGSAAEAALAPSPQVSVAEVTTHGSLQGRAAAASYSEGFANCPPRAAAAGEGVSAAGLTSALSCDGAEMGDGSGIAAPAEAVAVVAVCSADDVATGGGEGPQPPACCSANPGAEGNDPQANGAPPSAIIDLAIRTAAASEDPTGSVVASAAAVTGAEPHGVAPICGGGDAAAAAAAAASAAATTNPPQPQPAFGRELFLYLVASLVLSHRRKMLECEELDDVLRLFQTLSPINRSDVNDALRRAREFREKVAQRLPPPPLAASAAGKSTAICVSTPPPTLAAALAPSAAEAPPPPPPSSSERTWRGLMSFRSDSLKAKL
ncbi:hypothetical protein Vafri_12079 [Volvox africanus]|uniref:Rab-GAP TBC domain-containing protein n=1 Tax=Volvox africanus TaxID=51714 RepID=A0A8J4B9E4_9CHLO|nr:hypothetical protein Vafri_12079 [Volvox africanus]